MISALLAGPAVRTRWTILRLGLEERLAYRGDFMLATFIRFLPTITQIFLWQAIFAARSDATGGASMNSYRYEEMVAYYLLVMLARAFSSMPGLTTGIAREIRDGGIKRYLVQPLDIMDYLFWHRVAHKLVYYAVAAGPFAVVFFLLRGYFPGWPSAGTLLLVILALIEGFLIGFLLECLLGLVAFWSLEVSSFVFVYMLISYLLSGHMLPLEWFPAAFGHIANWLPFKFLAYVPAAILLGKYAPGQDLIELFVGGLWVIGLFLACRVTLSRGLRRYSAYGG